MMRSASPVDGAAFSGGTSCWRTEAWKGRRSVESTAPFVALTGLTLVGLSCCESAALLLPLPLPGSLGVRVGGMALSRTRPTDERALLLRRDFVCSRDCARNVADEYLRSSRR